MGNKPHSYTITLTPEHAKAVVLALELYQRIAMGQVDEVVREFERRLLDVPKTTEYSPSVLDNMNTKIFLRCSDKETAECVANRFPEMMEARDQGTAVCKQLKAILFPELLSGHYGICSPQTGQTAHLCYEASSSIKYSIACTEKADSEFKGVDHFEPCLFPSGVKPAPVCQAVVDP